VHRDTDPRANASKAMENYRHFLELQNTDPKLRAEALRRLGDLNLDAGEMERLEKEVTAVDLQGAEAIKLYSTLLKAYPDYPRNDQVLYQLARAYETTGQPAQALGTLDRIVQRYPQTPQLDEVQFRRGELLFSDKRYADAERAYSWMLYSRLGDLYVDKQRYQDAASVYRAYVARDPYSDQAPDLAMAAIEAYTKGGFSQLVLDGKHEFVERYNFDSPYWKTRGRADHPREVQELKTNLKDVATFFHASAQKSKRIPDFQEAARWYRDYLKSFPEDPDSAGVLTRAAEEIFAAGDRPRAISVSESILARQPPVDLAKQRIAWTIIAQSHFDQGEYDKAEPAFLQARALAGKDDK